jgi:hypothetical protein
MQKKKGRRDMIQELWKEGGKNRKKDTETNSVV